VSFSPTNGIGDPEANCALVQHRPMKQHRRSNQGFTLVEVIITVVIVGLLTAVAVPSFIDQARKGRRADAFDAMVRVQQEQERHRSQNLKYADSLSTLKLASSSVAGYYQLKLSEVSAQGFTLTAQPTSGGRQAADKDCAEFKLMISRGTQTRTASSQGGADSTTRCWPQ
jgi:type IV pilus assembly protein PilE